LLFRQAVGHGTPCPYRIPPGVGESIARRKEGGGHKPKAARLVFEAIVYVLRT
jgi:hypothetical protein